MRVAVIMSTYNGELYLKEQIESILNQIDVDLELFIRDDGSSDNTIQILEEYASDKIHVFQGENVGYGRSFISCLHMASGFDYYAFSDQDDFWEKEKLKRAVDLLVTRSKGDTFPAVYYSNLKVSDEKLNVLYTTKLEDRNQTLEGTSMRRSIAGCTMVFNQKLWEKIVESPIPGESLLLGHDSFIISLCYALGGVVCCDKNAYIYYRQHKSNTAGAPVDVGKRIKKEWKAFQHDKAAEMKIARAILDGWADAIPVENQDVLKLIATMGNDFSSKAHILFSNRFTTGDSRLTLVEKIKVLFAGKFFGRGYYKQ